MNKKNKLLLITLCIVHLAVKSTNNVITFFIKEYPEVKLPEYLQHKRNKQISNALTQPDFLNPKENTPVKEKAGASGVFALYKGYAQTSNLFGQVTFPRKQQAETIYLIITETISPEFIVGPSTVSHWEIDPNSSTAVYKMAINYDNDANSYYVNTTKVAAPQDNKISLQSIVIIGNPEDVYVPEGASIAELTANLNLPTIYIKEKFDRSRNASYVLTLKNYFSGIAETFKQSNLSISKISTR